MKNKLMTLEDFLNGTKTKTYLKKFESPFYAKNQVRCISTIIHPSGYEESFLSDYLHTLNAIREYGDYIEFWHPLFNPNVTSKDFFSLINQDYGDSGNFINGIIGRNLYGGYARRWLSLNNKLYPKSFDKSVDVDQIWAEHMDMLREQFNGGLNNNNFQQFIRQDKGIKSITSKERFKINLLQIKIVFIKEIKPYETTLKELKKYYPI